MIGFIRDYVKDPKVKSNFNMLDSNEKKKESGGRKNAISDRVASAVRRAQEEVSEQEQVETDVEYRMEQPERPLDRMQWTSSIESTEEIPQRPSRG